MHRRGSVVLWVLVLLAVVPVTADAASRNKRAPARLSAFSSCGALVDYGRANVGKDVPVRALPGAPVILTPGTTRDLPTAAPSPTTTEGATDDSFSGTNVQEVGVDEPDIVKSDGKRLFVIAGGKLLAVDVTGAVPKIVGSLALEGSSQELLLRDDRVLVIGAKASDIVPLPEARPEIGVIYPGSAETQLTEVDVKDPAAMKVARTLTVAGSYVSARLTGGTARVVLSTPPELPVEPATDVPGPRPKPEPTVRSTAAAKPGLRSFVPETVIQSRISGRTFKRSLVPCRDVRRPQIFSGLDLLTVLTIDLDRGLYNVDRDAVMAGAQVVYASTRSLYVASQRYVRELTAPDDIPSAMQTQIHRFDTSDPKETTYASSGSVPGFVINQYAMSEDKGVLRVASTEEPLWISGAPAREQESAVTLLRESGDRLSVVGRVGGLGRSERIYAVRFIGDTGYVVTFRQVDPLYVLDLSDPEHPKLASELKIAGYSAYLHPIGDGLLLGVGQDATEAGRTRGAQVSVFDVSDPAKPSRSYARALGSTGSTSAAEFDPHAFLWWGRTDTAVLPVQDTEPFAIGLRIKKPGGIDEIGRVSHGTKPYPSQILRSMVVGDRLYTLSDRGVASNLLATFAPLGFADFPAPG